MSIALRYAARSDVGLVRSNNQDSAYAGPHLLAVADGMGGHAGGDTASSLTIANLAPLDDEALGSGEILERLGEVIDLAREDLVSHARANPKLAGMGTTITALLRSGNKLAMAHLGDSRAYLLRDGTFTQVTVDHTFVQHLVDTGKITAEEAEVHPQRSVVMRVLGDFDLDLEPDLSMREAHPGDRWLLCSDGLSGYVSHETIERTLTEFSEPGECADRLVQLALRAGGPDNVTCIIADIVNLDELPDSQAPRSDVQVVGAAAITRADPTSALDGPAARAASLAAGARGASDADVESSTNKDQGSSDAVEPSAFRPKRRLWPWITALIVVVLGAVAVFGYQWTQRQYFVSISDGNVAIFQGVPQHLGPIDLSQKIESTLVQTATLPQYVVVRLENTISAHSLDEARLTVAELAATGAAETTPPTASPSPSAPTSGPTASPTPGTSQSPTPTPEASN